MLRLRPCERGDLDGIRKVCLALATEEWKQSDSMRQFLQTAFCDYYIENEPENAFVAEDEGRIVGYILCAKDFDAWVTTFNADYASRPEMQDFKAFVMGTIENPSNFAKDYPAHLHIDILPEYQHAGLGTRLMNELTAHLRSIGVCGVMLEVAAENDNAVSFYLKQGFKPLKTGERSIVMGKALG